MHKLAVALHFGIYNFVRLTHHKPRNNASRGRWPRRKAVELRKGRGNDWVLLAEKRRDKMNQTQHLAILYDIYCLMSLKDGFVYGFVGIPLDRVSG